MAWPQKNHELDSMDDTGYSDLDDATPSEIAEYWDNGQNSTQPHVTNQTDDQTSDSLNDQAFLDEVRDSYYAEDQMLVARAFMASEDWGDELDDPPKPGANTHEAIEHVVDDERWDVDKDAINFLAEVMSFDGEDYLIEHLGKYSTIRDLKMELPVLHRDPELELLMLKQRHEISINTRDVELWTHQEGDGKDLDREMDDPTLPARIEAEIANETLDVSEEAARFLRNIHKEFNSSNADLLDLLICLKSPDTYKVETPILLPQSRSQTPAAMDASLLEVNLTSTPEDLIAAEAIKVEQQLLEQDERGFSSMETFDHSGLPSNLASSETSSDIRLSPLIARTLEKVEVPLTPLGWTTTSSCRTVEAKDTTMVSHSLVPSPESDESRPDRESAKQYLQNCLDAIAGPAVEIMKHRLENEKLSALDTILRVPVPELDHSLPRPPWEFPAATANLIKRAMEDFDEGDLLFPGLSELEQKLSWTAFPVRLGRAMEEEIYNEELEIDESVARYDSSIEMDDELDIAELFTETGHHSILHYHDEDDEELKTLLTDHWSREEPSLNQHELTAELQTGPLPTTTVDESSNVDMNTGTELPYQTDIQNLLRRRKLELARSSNKSCVTAKTQQHHPTCPIASIHGPKQTQHNLAPSLGDSLGAGRIGQFLRLQGSAKLPTAPECASRLIPHTSGPTAVVVTPQEERHIPTLFLPAPQLPKPQDPVQVIFGSSVLADRTLVRALQTQLPMLEIIERHNITVTGGATNKAMVETHNDECDVTLSSDTGLIFTTLQKLKQKALPGQNKHTGVRERIAAVSAHYGRIVVLVAGGEGIIADAIAFDQRDCDAIADLTAFAAALQTALEVYVVPGGSKEIVKWLAPLIMQHAGTLTASKLMQEDTQWEHFLRLAGLNAYAAQTVLGKVNQIGLSGGRKGLAQLLQMTDEQHLVQFSTLLGEDVVRRLNEMVNAKWWSKGTAMH
ncbi:structural constituent of nuclear pore [Recurvomyces mirabilis]|uniref:Structural constituent of nuclear pore n=1 Tax=Recurvomyces mirabilis TaxID=574656 RepID=A0AAE0WU62_9PEZI|nr:structural constituent of nuclear pore [Recurvomyces mirabilis]KAK5160544.1 hypothetical protein LTS14_001556 [Recurvomyces mirabilis]